MKKANISVKCYFTETGDDADQIIRRSFQLYLKQIFDSFTDHSLEFVVQQGVS